MTEIAFYLSEPFSACNNSKLDENLNEITPLQSTLLSPHPPPKKKKSLVEQFKNLLFFILL